MNEILIHLLRVGTRHSSVSNVVDTKWLSVEWMHEREKSFPATDL